MAKKKPARKSGGAAGIQTVEGDEQIGTMAAEESNEARSDEMTPAESNGKGSKPERKKAKADPPANGGFGIGEIRKAAAFANSIGGLDKAIALLQILKVAKEIQ